MRLGFLAYGLIAIGSLTAAPNALPLLFEPRETGFAAQANGTDITIGQHGFTLETTAGPLHIRTQGANPHASARGQGVRGVQNEIIGRDPAGWRTGISLFERVRVAGVYPGIDLEYHGQDSHLEYDFVAAPHSNPARIALKVDGGSLALDAAGDLHIALPGGESVQHRPVAFQVIGGHTHPVLCRFVLLGNWVRFAIGAYDPEYSLTIDPVVAYSSFLGGTATDEGHAVAVNASGDFFIAGRTFSTTGSNSHVLLLKALASGNFVQSVFGGTSGNDSANAIALDSAGNVYLAGSTTSADFPIAGATIYQPELLGEQNAFVMALDPTIATPIFSTYLGGSFSDQALGIAVGPNNNLFIVGDTESYNFSLISSDAFQVSNHGGFDAFLVSLTSLGVPNFGTYLGGSGDEHANAVAVDSTGAIYVVGSTSSSDYPASPYPGFPEPFQLSNHGGEDGFAIKFFPSGLSAYWSTYLGGENADSATAVALDAAGNVYIAGTTGSVGFPVSPGAFQTTYQGGGSDGFVLSLQNNGQFGNWSTYVGGELSDAINAIALDSSNNIVLTGTSDSLGFPVTTDAVQAKNAGSQDAILATLNNAGTALLFATYFGGSGIDIGTGVALDSNGHTYLTGITESSNNDFPVTSGARQLAFGGGSSDAFFSVFGCTTGVPTITTGGVVNAASNVAAAIAPGTVISIYGTNLGCTPSAASTVPLPVTLGSVSVKVNGAAIPLFYVGESQINAQLPYDLPTGVATISVTGPGGTSTTASFPVIAAGPGVFVINGQAAALNADGTLNTPKNPAKVGSYISVYFTGQGPVSQAITAGAIPAKAPPYTTVTSPNSAAIGGAAATVYFMGLAPGLVGLAQANLLVPNLPTGNYPLTLTVGGVSSAPAQVSVTQ